MRSLAVGVLFSGFVWAQAPSSAPQKSVLEGKVLNSATGEPVRKARVSISRVGEDKKDKPERGSGGAPITDAAGRFEFPSLTPGVYLLSAFRPGYAQPHVHGEPKLVRVALAPGEEQRDVVIRLTPLGAIAGRILDEDGDPIQGMQVDVMQDQFTASGRGLSNNSESSTNDRGEYRIFDLAPGRYYVKAGSQQMMGGGSQGREQFSISYYPGTPDAAAAAPVDLGPGQQMDGMDLTLHTARAATIRGRVLNPGYNLMVGLMKFMQGGSSSTNTSVDDHDGKFKLAGVSPGPYILTAQGTIGGQHYSTHVPIQVGTADMDDIDLRLQPPVHITGQFRIEGKASDKAAKLSVTLAGSAGEATVRAAADGSFLIESLEADVYHASVDPPDGLYLKSVRWADREVLESGIDLTQGAAESPLAIVLSANGGEVDGVVEDEAGTPAAGAIVALVPADRGSTKTRFKIHPANASGGFRLRGIAPGSYKLFAWTDADPNQIMYDPDFLKPFDAKGQSLEIAERSKQSVQLRVIAQAEDIAK